MSFANLRRYLAFGFVVGALTAAGFFTRDHWSGWVHPPSASTPEVADGTSPEPCDRIFLSAQVQQNLRLKSKPLQVAIFWKTLEVPGTIIDRPGRNVMQVVAPIAGVVTDIRRFPGDLVQPGEPLFTLRLTSEQLQTIQSDLVKATSELRIAEQERKRIAGISSAGQLAQADAQVQRWQLAIRAARNELATKGFSAQQIDSIAEGKFVTEFIVSAPIPKESEAAKSPWELQVLAVSHSQQVQAGQAMCELVSHQSLLIEGKSFSDEVPLVERAVAQNWPIAVDFPADSSEWPTTPQSFSIQRSANVIDPITRTFTFSVPLANQSRTIEKDGHSQIIWRYRPGEKVRLRIPTERIDNVFILPAEAVVREGASAFVFRQNADTFERRPVQIIARDRDRVVIANHDSVTPGVYVAQSGAVQINRMMKSSSSTAPKGYHMHADGSLHKNDEPEK
ncbi:MAG: efflux RND transporter periplasmic adaptor subunit [Gemmataceae bacterium]